MGSSRRVRATMDGVADLAELADRVRAIGLEAGLDAVGIAPAEPFTATRRHLQQRKAAGLHAGMQFTFRNPGRSTDPQRVLRGARALVVGARSYARQPPRRDGEGRVAAYAWPDHYGDLKAALRTGGDEPRRHGWRTRVLADDNSLVDREAAVRAGLGWYGKNANVLLPG